MHEVAAKIAIKVEKEGLKIRQQNWRLLDRDKPWDQLYKMHYYLFGLFDTVFTKTLAEQYAFL